MSDDTRHPKVLFDFPEVGRTRNPYTALMLSAVSPHARPLSFSWRVALFGRYDVLHLNWPEGLVRDESRPKAVLKWLMTVALLVRLRLSRVPIVRTVHNLRPHAPGSRAERLLLGWIDRRTQVNVYLNESAENDPRLGVVILHGRYPLVEGLAVERSARSGPRVTMLTFGLLRPFKGIEQAIRALAQAGDAAVDYTIAGFAEDRAYGEELGRAVADYPNIRLRNAFLADAELDALIADSDLVALPYKYLYNSGAAILALSRRRHVLVPDAPATRSLADEVGRQWVTLFEAPLSPEDIATAAAAARSCEHATDGPDLSRRSWPAVGALHGELYRAVLAASRLPGGLDRARRATRESLARDEAFLDHSALNAMPRPR